MTNQPDLFAVLTPPCGNCKQLGAAIDSGVRYCWGQMTWRRAEDRVEGCVYRDQPCRVQPTAEHSRNAALEDLLTSPRHSVAAKDRRWLQAELRAERKQWAAA